MLPTGSQPHGNGSVSRSCKQLSKFNVTVSHYKLKPESRSRRNAVYGGVGHHMKGGKLARCLG